MRGGAVAWRGGAGLPEQVRLKPVGQLRRGLEASERSKDSLSLEVEGVYAVSGLIMSFEDLVFICLNPIKIKHTEQVCFFNFPGPWTLFFLFSTTNNQLILP